jgi:hypothetical protein
MSEFRFPSRKPESQALVPSEVEEIQGPFMARYSVLQSTDWLRPLHAFVSPVVRVPKTDPLLREARVDFTSQKKVKKKPDLKRPGSKYWKCRKG